MNLQTKLLSVIICYFISFPISAQEELQDFVSVFITKPKKTKFQYAFNDQALKTIKIRDNNYVERPKLPGDGLRDLGRNAVTEFAGSFLGSISTATEVTCNPRGMLICNNTSLNWEVHLYCPGIMQTAREKEDEGISVSSYTTMWWKKEAIGIILDSGDTIGTFKIISEPRTDPRLSQWNDLPFRLQAHRYKVPDKKRIGVSLENLADYYRDFGTIGDLRGEKFTLLFNGELNQSWLFMQDSLVMLFNEDIDDFSLYLNKDTRILPNILWKQPESISKKYDLMRMALVSRYLSKILSKGGF